MRNRFSAEQFIAILKEQEVGVPVLELCRKQGVGGAITWKAADRIATSVFAEYWRLQDQAADSSIVKEIGSADQFLFGVSATYRFDFTL